MKPYPLESDRKLSLPAIASIFGLLFLIAHGCAHHPETNATSNNDAYEKMRMETERAFEMVRRADLVIFYERSTYIKIQTAGQTNATIVRDETLPMAIASAASERKLAVIVIGKATRHELSKPQQLRAKVDELEAIVRESGFQQIVFQLASATGRPIYRE